MTQCPCDSGKDYQDCCGPIHDGKRKAASPVELMRARYGAFARGLISFLEQSLHPKSRGSHDAQQTQEWSRNSEWLGLEIIDTTGGTFADDQGHVEFIARYKAAGDEVEHHELAEFRRHQGNWFFYDGRIIGGDPIEREEPKVGRNDPCPCGSGKKYKKCCG